MNIHKSSEHLLQLEKLTNKGLEQWIHISIIYLKKKKKGFIWCCCSHSYSTACFDIWSFAEKVMGRTKQDSFLVIGKRWTISCVDLTTWHRICIPRHATSSYSWTGLKLSPKYEDKSPVLQSQLILKVLL